MINIDEFVFILLTNLKHILISSQFFTLILTSFKGQILHFYFSV